MANDRASITAGDEDLLERATRVGREVWIRTDTGVSVLCGVVEDEVQVLTDGAKHVIQRIRLADGGAHGYETGSFVVDPGTGRVKWSQRPQVISETDYRELLEKAKTRGWPLA
ncbi:MAG: hypothetical protein HYR51_05175 [Candidatus Rokubacteria bacterium]|nr:hypothetical protein [Candidatus Rokubacteria bacterium]